MPGHRETKPAKPFRRKGVLLLVILIPSLFAAIGLAVYHATRDQFENQPVYRLHTAHITVPDPPAWVPPRFVESVLQSSGLDCSGILLDANLPQKLSQAFAADPWVESVRQVEIRFPSGADVKLAYRAPVAFVELPSEGLFPIDRHGVLLPTAYFINDAPEKKDDYPHIRGIRSMPLGSVGTPWGDPLVHEAARLAEVLEDVSREMEIVLIQSFQEESPTGVRTLWKLRTAKGTDILWGRYDPEEQKSKAKKDRLRELDEIYRSLDNVPGHFQPVDLTED